MYMKKNQTFAEQGNNKIKAKTGRGTHASISGSRA